MSLESDPPRFQRWRTAKRCDASGIAYECRWEKSYGDEQLGTKFDKNAEGTITIDTAGYYRIDAVLYNGDGGEWIGCFIQRNGHKLAAG